jgi:thermitase
MRALCLAIAALMCIAPAGRSHPMVERGEFRGYLVKLTPQHDGRDGPDDLARVRAASGGVLGAGWRAEATGVPSEFRIVFQGATALSAAAAWENVHQLRQTGAFERAEPLYASLVSLLAADDSPYGECGSEWSGKWKPPVPPPPDLALKDAEWSLKGEHGANVIAAWKAFENRKARPGEGVVVGHPDTGYLEHPTLTPALLGIGFDFVARRRNARDRTDDGRLQFPGHGTRTASVIVGLAGYKVRPDSTKGISGAAPGARLMPLRVANRVILFDRIDLDMGHLSRAIRVAAIGDPNFVEQRAHVISISLGGAPSRAVEEAIRVALRRNTIVLAAAGNNVPRHEVVWPARYPGVAAIAATNARSQAWSGTSRGPSITVSAPGENVWTARLKTDARGDHPCVEMGTGTSYAVATAAGVAALWLSQRAADPEVGAVADAPAAFIQAVRRTARKPARQSDDEDWDVQQLGPGIVDAEQLLDEPPIPDASRRAETCVDLKSAASVFGDRGQSVTARLLFADEVSQDDACRAAGHLADEVAFLFATDGVVGEAVTMLSRGRATSDTVARLSHLRRVMLSREISTSLRARLLAAERASGRRRTT